MELLKKACEEMGIKFFKERDEDYVWIEARYHLEDPAVVEGDFSVKRKLNAPHLSKKPLEKMEAVRDVPSMEFGTMEGALVGAMKQLIKIEQEKTNILGIYMNKERRLFYATGKISTEVV